MKSVKLFRILQGHAGDINALALEVYNEKKETEEALKEAKEYIERVAGLLSEAEKT